MAIMTDIATSVLGTIAGFTVVPIGRQFGYMFCYNGNIEKLQREAEVLEAKRMDVEQMVEVAKNNCQTISKEVELWLENVRLEKEKVDTILGDTEKVGKGCLNEWCPNLKSRYWVSRKAAKKRQDLGRLLTKGENFSVVAGPQQPLGIVPDQPPIVRETQGDGILEAAAHATDQIGSSSSGGLDSRESIMRDVMEAVKDDKIRIIGIWGMGGVGKTTLVKEVFRRAKLDKSMFDEVAMTAVSKEPEMKKIQEDIAEWLSLKLEERNTIARAIRLHCRLTQKQPNGKPKRILIILDDVWYKLNLEDVGIPYEDSDQNGCKIVLTSRYKHVCDQMKTNKTFFVDVLLKQEARSLFRKLTDYSLYASTDLHGIAEEIVKECGGLPIAIAIIANALVNKGQATWKFVLRQLKNSALQGENAVVYKTLEMSYNFLKTKEIKDFFLHCCLFPEDFNIQIEDLVRYRMGLTLFKNIDNLQDARDEAHAHVDTLMNSSLLLGGERQESVKMHDLVRDFALDMTREGEQVFMVKFGDGLKAWPIKDTHECYTSISLQCDEMHELPVGLKLLSLKLLQLLCLSNRRSLQFPEEFYQGMGKLEVLVLRNMSIPSLPGSLRLLTNLRTLSLYECALWDNVSVIGYLEKLEILSFARSEMEELAGEIGELSRLRLLDLTDCGNLRRIPPSVLPRLNQLEELYMRGTSSFLWAEEQSNATNASFAELKKLTNLVCLHIQIPLKVLPIDLTLLEKLEKFKLSIGSSKLEKFNLISYRSWTNQFSVFQNDLELCADNSVVLEGIMNALCMRTENLYLQVKDLKNLPESMSLLKLIVKSCDELVSIVNTMGRRDQPAPFGNLREIELWNCNKLKNIFSLSIASGLSKLQSLHIQRCQMLEEFFCTGDDKAVGKNIEFPNLKVLGLKDLPNLVGFCKAVEKVELPQLEELKLCRVPKLTSVYIETDTVASEPHNASPKHPLFNQKDLKNLPERVGLLKLKRLRVESCDELVSIVNTLGRRDTTTIVFPILKSLVLLELSNLEDICCGLQSFIIPSSCMHQPAPFGNLREIELGDCNKMKNIFSLSIARGLSKLQSLEIRRCQMMEEIFCNGDDKAVGKNIEFPNLKELLLLDLPNLVGFCKAVEKVELPQLQGLYLKDLPKLTSLYPETDTVASEPHNASPKHPLFNQKDLKNLPERVGLLKLKRLRVESCDELVSIVNTLGQRDTTTIVFPILESLVLLELSNLEDICCGLQSFIILSSSIHQPAPFGNLREIELGDCNKMKNIFSLSIARGLSKLQSLEIRRCQMMEEIFCNGDDKAVGKNIEFPNLKELLLLDLPNLVGFCKAVEKVDLPQLQSLRLEYLPKLTSVYTETDTVASEPHNASPKYPLFNQKVTLNNLEELTVSEMENLIEIWPSQFSDDSISKLRHMAVDNCGRLMSVFPSNIIQGMQNLESRRVENCDRLKNIFSLSIARGLVRVQSLYIRNCQTVEAIIFKERGEEDENGAKIEFPNLNELVLEDLPNLVGLCKSVDEVELELPLLKKVYLCGLPKFAGLYPRTKTLDSEHHHESPKHHFFNPNVKLSNLEKLTVSRMENLLSVFPSNIIEGLQNLQSLRIDNCQMMEEIFSKDENDAKIEFPNLKELFLSSLPNLVGFSKSVDEVELPQLKDLALYDLPKLQTKTSDSEHLFNLKVPLTNLVALNMCKMDHPTTVFPATVIQQLLNLGKLLVSDCRSVEVVFDFQGLNINESRELVPLTQLKELIISKLPKLTHVWKKGQHVIQGFQNLTTLRVERCGSLKHLFTPSVARILVELIDLEISDCMLFEAIVAKEEGGEEKQDDEEEILFPQLARLCLSGLPNLLAIAPKPYTLNLSSLIILLVNECGKGAEPLNDKRLQLGRFW